MPPLGVANQLAVCFNTEMTKERKTQSELEAMIFAEAHQEMECEGLTGVTVVGITDERVDFTWRVSFTDNSTPMCEHTIAEIVSRLQKQYDLQD